jgi:hypothetical protein
MFPFFLQTSIETFFCPDKNQQVMLELLSNFGQKQNVLINFSKIHLVVPKFFYADRWTELERLIGTFLQLSAASMLKESTSQCPHQFF